MAERFINIDRDTPMLLPVDLRFRQFLMRGVEKVANEWNLVCSAYNLKRSFNLLRMPQATALTSGVGIPC